MEIYKLIYEKLSKYGDITQNDVKDLMTHFKTIQIKSESFYYKPTEYKNEFAFQLNGLLRSYIISEKGDDRTLDFCRSGDILSTTNGDIPSPYWIQAIKDTTLVSIENSQLEILISNNSKLQIIIFKMMESCLTVKSQREIELLSLDGREKYLKFLEENNDIVSDISQLHIASYLGISPVSLSRIKNNL